MYLSFFDFTCTTREMSADTAALFQAVMLCKDAVLVAATAMTGIYGSSQHYGEQITPGP